jgi:hypothetical protein
MKTDWVSSKQKYEFFLSSAKIEAILSVKLHDYYIDIYIYSVQLSMAKIPRLTSPFSLTHIQQLLLERAIALALFRAHLFNQR